MTKLSVEVPDDVAQRVAAAAAERGVAPEAMAAQVLAQSFPARRRLGFIGMGHVVTKTRVGDGGVAGWRVL
jgi:predicted transcriptional regulator